MTKIEKEHGIDAAILRTRKIELPVRDTLPDVAAVIKLAVDHMDVRIEHERVLMQLSRAWRILQQR